VSNAQLLRFLPPTAEENWAGGYTLAMPLGKHAQPIISL